ncbi:protein of unknown function [Cruoricaptor ignavus]|uniref:DUF4407 domain-containing protein n=1 Tax=Cruoricaptor ignavus TaxID=1118202 RepID=A0A1M6H740_9FLAO|nr:DUF4407 domain-containing protein [Cruoricaptor ignavus]SHJ17929.1 protein of unknown function [Cruoricaptor ignavus]
MGILHKPHRGLHALSGEDVNLITQINAPKINRNFNVIGFLVMLILIGCILSVLAFTINILEGSSKLMSVPAALFFGLAVTNIYILLLYTISPPLLFDKSMLSRKQKNEKNFVFQENTRRFREWLTPSLLLRVGFIILFAVILAQPLNVLFFEKEIQTEIDAYKMHLKSEMILSADSLRILDEKKLFDEFHNSAVFISKADSTELARHATTVDEKAEKDWAYLQQASRLKRNLALLSGKTDMASQVRKEGILRSFSEITEQQIASDAEFLENQISVNLSDPLLQKRFDGYAEKLRGIITQKHISNQRTATVIDNNNFYIRKIMLVYETLPQAKLLTFISLIVFLVPIILKFQIRQIRFGKNESFYTVKQQAEHDIVLKNYRKFKRRFGEIFTENQQVYHGRALAVLHKDLTILEKIKPEKARAIREEIGGRYSAVPEFYEKYADPPFNLIERKKTIRERSQKDFLAELYREE